jgi:predicted nucleic acid-binding protein
MSDDNNERRFACKVKRRIGTYEIIIPQFVLGEVMSVTLRKYNKNLNQLQSKIRILSNEVTAIVTPATGLPVIESKHLDHMSHFMNVCKFSPTDASILSVVIEDADSDYFITTDTNLINSGSIYSYEQQLRDKDLRKKSLNITEIP